MDISENEWNRQRLWDLKRDTILNVLNWLADFYDILNEFNSLIPEPDEYRIITTENNWMDEMSKTIDRFNESSLKYSQTVNAVDLTIGGNVSIALKDYFDFALSLFSTGLSTKLKFLNAGANEELASRHVKTILAMRKVLGINNAGNLNLFVIHSKK